MGFEFCCYFHERLDGGGYNKSETKELRKKVGEPFEDISLEKLAAAIMGQLARRDIWVTDVDIYEYSKKKINFRETTGGIVIKNKKFMVDGGIEIVSQELVEAPIPQKPVQYPHEVRQPVKQNGKSMKPIKWVIFAPSEMKSVKEKQLRFTVEKKYAVFREDLHPKGIGMIYYMVDDIGREQMVSDEYFVPATQSLVADKELGFTSTSDIAKNDASKLLWQGVIDEPAMPSIR